MSGMMCSALIRNITGTGGGFLWTRYPNHISDCHIPKKGSAPRSPLAR
jgi:hypothetical protein